MFGRTTSRPLAIRLGGAAALGIAVVVTLYAALPTWSGEDGEADDGVVVVRGAGGSAAPFGSGGTPAPTIFRSVPLPNGAPVVRAPVPVEPRERPATRGEFLGSLGARPVAQGYQVAPDAPSSITKVGLVPGDVVEVVNGRRMGNPDADQEAFAAAAAAGFARFEVVRDGQRITLDYPPQ